MSAPTLKKAKNGRYYVHWTDGRRSKRVSTGTGNLAEAKGFLAQWLLMEQSVAKAADRTIAQCWTAYYERHVLIENASVSTAEHTWNNLRAHFGDLDVSAVTSDVVDEYIALRRAGRVGPAGKPVKDGTIRRELATLRACLSWCANPKRKLLDPALLPLFDLPKDSDPRDRWLRTEELQRLFAAAAKDRPDGRLSRAERFLWLALETAGRSSAIRELTWDRVDFETLVIDLNVPGRKRTKKRRAVVPISKTLLPVLQRAFEERTGPLVVDSEAEILYGVVKIAKRAGVEGVTPHVLRHTAATHMARKGVPLWKIAKVLGNTLAMVEQVYAKHCPDDIRADIDLISNDELELTK